MILVTGATGFVGRNLVKRLIADGESVRVIVPRPWLRTHVDKLPWPSTVELVPGTVYEAETLHHALADVHTVFHLASAQWWGSRRDLQRVDLLGTQEVIAAARAARIGRIIALSHLGASPSSAFVLLRYKGRAEDAIRTSGLAYTIIRSGVVFGPEDRFVNGIATLLRSNPLLYVQPANGETLLHPLFINDLVEVLVRALDMPETVDRIIEIGGPEYHTYNELIRTVMRVTNAPRNIVSLPPYLMRTITGAIRRVFPRWPITPQWYDLLAANRVAPLGALETTFGITPARFEDTIVTYMRHRRYTPEFVRAVLRRRVGHI